jgi:hypothetical protein
MKPEITVRIDALEIHGVGSFDAELFGASFDRELSALIAQRAPQSGAWRVGSVALHVGVPADSSLLGAQVAQAVYGQMLGGAR